jgi:hypothetical protein
VEQRLPPQLLESCGVGGGVAHGVLNVAVPEIILNEAGVCALVGESKADLISRKLDRMGSQASKIMDTRQEKAIRAIDLGHKLITLAHGYYSHTAAVELSLNKDILCTIRPQLNNLWEPVGEARKKNGGSHQFLKMAWLEHDQFNHHIRDELDRIWLTGALIYSGDALGNKGHFGHAPCLELIYHLRNAAAHNNRFMFTEGGRKRLSKHPAHTRDGPSGYPTNSIFEITPDLEGTLLMWEFMEAGDILDALKTAGYYLHEFYSQQQLQIK